MDIKKILIWIPAIIMAMLIFGFSKQDGEESTGLSYKTADIILTVCDKAGIVDYNDNNRDSMIESVQFPSSSHDRVCCTFSSYHACTYS